MTNYKYLTTHYPHHEQQLLSYLQHNKIRYNFVSDSDGKSTYEVKGKVDMKRLQSTLKRNGIYVTTVQHNVYTE